MQSLAGTHPPRAAARHQAGPARRLAAQGRHWVPSRRCASTGRLQRPAPARAESDGGDAAGSTGSVPVMPPVSPAELKQGLSELDRILVSAEAVMAEAWRPAAPAGSPKPWMRLHPFIIPQAGDGPQVEAQAASLAADLHARGALRAFGGAAQVPKRTYSLEELRLNKVGAVAGCLWGS